MGACYGDGILDAYPTSFESLDEKVDFLKEFAGQGLTSRFCEVIEGRVLELNHLDGTVTTRWLSEAEAAPIVAATKQLGGSAPYSMYPICLEEQVFIPDCVTTGGTLELPGTEVEEWTYAPLGNTILRLEAWIGHLEAGEAQGDIDFNRGILAMLKICQQHKLLFVIGE